MNNTDSNCRVKNLQFEVYYEKCLKCDVFFWIFIGISCYVGIANLTLMYGLKKTTKKFKNPQILQFVLALIDLIATIYFQFIYIVPFYLQHLKNEKCRITIVLLRTIRNILYSFEPFILTLMIISRYVTICYPFQINLQRIVNSNRHFISTILALFAMTGILTAIVMVIYQLSFSMQYVIAAIYYILCFLSMAILNIRLILKLRNNCKRTCTNEISIEKQKKAVKTLMMVMASTICCNTIYILVVLVKTIESYCGKTTAMEQLLDYIKFIYLLYFLGMGINSNIFLCRNSKIIRLIKNILLKLHNDGKFQVNEKSTTSLS